MFSVVFENFLTFTDTFQTVGAWKRSWHHGNSPRWLRLRSAPAVWKFRCTGRRGRSVGGFTKSGPPAYYDTAGKRVRRSFSDREKAQAEAERVAAALSRGQAEAVEFTAADAEKYGRAIRLLKPTGIPLLAAVEEYVDARTILPTGFTLKQSAKHLADAVQATDTRPVREIVEELLNDREAAGCSEVHLRDLRFRLGRFADAFQCPLGSVSAGLVREFIQNLKTDAGKPLANRTRRNVLRIVSGLYHFAGKRKYIPGALVEDVRAIEAPKAAPSEAGIWTLEEMSRILTEAKPYLIPALAVGAFVGLRIAEIARLDWKDVRLSEGVIVLAATKTKTASRRVVPILPNLSQWLTPHAQESGPVSPASTANTLAIQFSRTGERAGLKWIPNALRHSFCSYRLATTHDAARVATEAGNSASMVHRHYKSLVTEAQGKEWFSIVPDRPENVIAMPREAAG